MSQPNKRKPVPKNKASSAEPEPMVMVPVSFLSGNNKKFVPGPGGSRFFVNSSSSKTPQASASAGSSARRKPWKSTKNDEDCDDDDDDNDDNDDDYVQVVEELDSDDFAPKRARRSLPTKLSLSKKEPTSASAQLALRMVRQLPEKFMGGSSISTVPATDCMSCGVYFGEIMFKPCGHARFCTKCVNKVHQLSHKNKRLVQCPVVDCFSLIEGWLRLRNCMV